MYTIRTFSVNHYTAGRMPMQRDEKYYVLPYRIFIHEDISEQYKT